MDKRNKPMSVEQKNILIEFMSLNPQLTGKFSNTFIRQDSITIWKDITNILNATSGASKEWKVWRKEKVSAMITQAYGTVKSNNNYSKLHSTLHEVIVELLDDETNLQRIQNSLINTINIRYGDAIEEILRNDDKFRHFFEDRKFSAFSSTSLEKPVQISAPLDSKFLITRLKNVSLCNSSDIKKQCKRKTELAIDNVWNSLTKQTKMQNSNKTENGIIKGGSQSKELPPKENRQKVHVQYSNNCFPASHIDTGNTTGSIKKRKFKMFSILTSTTKENHVKQTKNHSSYFTIKNKFDSRLNKPVKVSDEKENIEDSVPIDHKNKKNKLKKNTLHQFPQMKKLEVVKDVYDFEIKEDNEIPISKYFIGKKEKMIRRSKDDTLHIKKAEGPMKDICRNISKMNSTTVKKNINDSMNQLQTSRFYQHLKVSVLDHAESNISTIKNINDNITTVKSDRDNTKIDYFCHTSPKKEDGNICMETLGTIDDCKLNNLSMKETCQNPNGQLEIVKDHLFYTISEESSENEMKNNENTTKIVPSCFDDSNNERRVNLEDIQNRLKKKLFFNEKTSKTKKNDETDYVGHKKDSINTEDGKALVLEDRKEFILSVNSLIATSPQQYNKRETDMNEYACGGIKANDPVQCFPNSIGSVQIIEKSKRVEEDENSASNSFEMIEDPNEKVENDIINCKLDDGKETEMKHAITTNNLPEDRDKQKTIKEPKNANEIYKDYNENIGLTTPNFKNEIEYVTISNDQEENYENETTGINIEHIEMLNTNRSNKENEMKLVKPNELFQVNDCSSTISNNMEIMDLTSSKEGNQKITHIPETHNSIKIKKMLTIPQNILLKVVYNEDNTQNISKLGNDFETNYSEYNSKKDENFEMKNENVSMHKQDDHNEIRNSRKGVRKETDKTPCTKRYYLRSSSAPQKNKKMRKLFGQTEIVTRSRASL